MEEDGKRDHLDTDQHCLKTHVDVREGEFGCLFEHIRGVEDPEDDLYKAAQKSQYRALTRDMERLEAMRVMDDIPFARR